MISRIFKPTEKGLARALADIAERGISVPEGFTVFGYGRVADYDHVLRSEDNNPDIRYHYNRSWHSGNGNCSGLIYCIRTFSNLHYSIFGEENNKPQIIHDF